MEIEGQVHRVSWRWSLLISVVFLNICLPNLVLSYGVLLVHASDLGQPLWLGLSTPTIFILTYGLTQCWFREAADSWGGVVGYRVMASVGLAMVVASQLICAFIPINWHPLIYGVFGGLGSSLLSAQVDAVVFETYDSYLGIIRGLCFAGQAIGQSMFPHILSSLIDAYGYHMSFIVIAGIMLQTLPAVMLLRIDDTLRKPVFTSRYTDSSRVYSLFSNGESQYYTAELQLTNLENKCWKSPSDDYTHRTEDLANDAYEDDGNTTTTPPPSPEEKRKNIFGVEILPEIPEESEESDIEDQNTATDHKNKLSDAIKRFSTLSDNLSDYISKQIRRDSQASNSAIKEYSEVEVTYGNIAPITDIHREKLINSFSFRCQSLFASAKRKFVMPSYRVYRMKRRLLFALYYLNDTFIKPLTRSLSCWKFYPSLILCFVKLSLTALLLVLLPIIATQMYPKITLTESDFLMSLHGFTWICFLLSTPWLAQTPKRNFKYIAVFGLYISTAACYLIAEASNHDTFSIGCVVAGIGYGAITSCWETAVQDFIGVRKWPKLHSTLEIFSAILLASFVAALMFFVKDISDLQYSVFILAIAISIVTIVWSVIAIVSLYLTKIKSRFAVR